MRVLVTGSNGLVGSRLARQLVERGHEVIGCGRGPQRTSSAFEYVDVDLRDGEMLQSRVRAARPEVIVNSGSMTDVDACETASSDAFRVNGVAPGILATVATELEAHLVQVSTDYVFDGEAGPYSEEDIPNPRGVYALTKHIGEQSVRALARSWAIARTAVVYGWPAAGRPNFGTWLLDALQRKQPVRLFEDQFVSPTLADSVAEQLVEVVERRLLGYWNVAGADVVNRVQFGQAMCIEFGLDNRFISPSRLADAKLKSPRPARSGLKTGKAAAAFEAQPLPLNAALSRFHKSFRSDGR